MHAGKAMYDGTDGFKKQVKTGLEWISKAAAQNYPPALCYLSELYREGRPPEIRKSQEKANELLLKSANLGLSQANAKLARNYSNGEDGFEKDQDEGLFRASVAFALNGSDTNALFVGMYHHRKDIPDPSPYLACYYLNIAANSENVRVSGMACCSYSRALKNLSLYLHDGNIVEIPGSNVVPAMFFWLRKSRDMGYNKAGAMLKEWESSGQSQCANCYKGAQGGGKFKQCSKCKAQWYCSKECQIEAWKAGHKKDCKRARLLKFEDYLNAE